MLARCEDVDTRRDDGGGLVQCLAVGGWAFVCPDGGWAGPGNAEAGSGAGLGVFDDVASGAELVSSCFCGRGGSAVLAVVIEADGSGAVSSDWHLTEDRDGAVEQRVPEEERL